MPAELNSPARSREVPVCPVGILILMWVYRHLGQRACRMLVWVVVLVAYPFLGRARAASSEFMQQWRTHTGQRGCSAFRHLLTFAYTLADRLACRMGLWGHERVNVCTPDALQEMLARYRHREGMFCLASHLGCFDMLRVLFAEPQPGGGGEIHVFMDTAATEAFSRMQGRYASRSDLYVHAVQELGVGMSIHMAQKLEDGAIVVMAGDRLWREGERAVLKKMFFGREARFPRGCFSWAAALGVPVYTFCLAEQGGRYDLYIRRLSEQSENRAPHLAERYVRTLEEWCARYPENWFNFYSYWS